MTAGEPTVIRGDAELHLGFPGVARLPDGRLFVVYREGASHAGPDGRIVAQLGTDEGSTWRSAIVLVDNPDVDDRDPSIAVGPDDRVVLTWFATATHRLEDGRAALHGIFAAELSDGSALGAVRRVDDGPPLDAALRLDPTGGTWVTEAGEGVRVWATTSPGVAIDDGWVIPAYGAEARPDWRHDPRSRIALWRLVEGAESGFEQPVSPERDPRIWFQEPALLVLADGTWLLHARSANGDNPVLGRQPQLQTLSRDGGVTFERWRELGWYGHAPELVELAAGVVLTGFRRVSETLERAWVSVAISQDAGGSWSDPVDLRACGDADCGYLSVVQLDERRWLVVYYLATEAESQIVSQTLTIGGLPLEETDDP